MEEVAGQNTGLLNIKDRIFERGKSHEHNELLRRGWGGSFVACARSACSALHDARKL